MRARILFSLVAALGTCATASLAQMTWREAAFASRSVFGSGMIHDSARGVTVGLFDRSNAPLMTWEWDGSSWRERDDVGTPAARIYFALAYDSARAVVLLVGGYDVTAGPATTWEYDGRRWSMRSPANAPVFRGRHAMTYDPVRQRVLLFGGETVNGDQNDLWEWDGADWVQRVAANPPSPRSGAGFVWDTARGKAILFGGYDGTIPNRSAKSDTWSWDGTRWQQLSPATTPPARGGVVPTYDSVRQRVVMFGGWSGSVDLGDTWEWDGSDWSRRLAPAYPPRAEMPSQAFDAARGETLVFVRDRQTWAWDGTAWRYRAPNVPLRGATAIAYDRGRQLCVLFGGTKAALPWDDTWEWDGTAWLERRPPTRPPGRSEHCAVYDSRRGVVLVFGGKVLGQILLGDDLWAWDGTTWLPLGSTPKPPGRAASAMAFDSSRGVAVLFGGQTTNGEADDTWEWDGSSWARRSPPTTPPRRVWHAMAYDERRGVTVMVGGGLFDGTQHDDVWEWDGIDWRQAHPRTVVTGLAHATLDWDRRRERAVLVPWRRGETWEWDGVDWRLATPSAPPADIQAAAAYDDARGELVRVGRESAGGYWNTHTWLYAPSVRGTATAFGHGCGGATGVPTLDASGAPILGNREFAFVLAAVPPGAPTVVGVSPVRADLPLPGGCRLLAALPWVHLPSAANSAGIARAPVAIPVAVSLRGAAVYAQGFAVDPSGALVGLGALSHGLGLVIGD